MSSLVSLLERLTLGIERVGGLFLAGITILIVVSAIGRYVLAVPVPDAFDLSRLLLGVAIMWGFASVGYRGSHIKVDLFAELMPVRVRRWVDFFAWSVLLGFTTLLAWKMGSRVLSARASGEATFDLRIAVWPLLALVCLGAIASIFTILVRLWLIGAGRGGLDSFETIETDDGKRDVEG